MDLSFLADIEWEMNELIAYNWAHQSFICAEFRRKMLE